MGYREDLEVDPDNLDEEWLNHGQRFMDYVEQAAQAEYEKSVAAQHRTNVRAEVARRIRRKQKKYGIDKLPATVKESVLKGLVEENKKVKKADQDYFKAVRNERILSNAVTAMGSYRRTTLERVTDRVEKGFFAEPRYKGKDSSKMKNRREGIRMRRSLQKRQLKKRR